MKTADQEDRTVFESDDMGGIRDMGCMGTKRQFGDKVGVAPRPTTVAESQSLAISRPDEDATDWA